jgi:pimeloyl-ACP methyl ester carboxylesterase
MAGFAGTTSAQAGAANAWREGTAARKVSARHQHRNVCSPIRLRWTFHGVRWDRTVCDEQGVPFAVDVDILVNDVRLRATDVGDGAPVVLLHAGGERRTVWEPVQAALAAGGFRTLAVDQRGHGESGGSRSDGLPAFAADVRQLVRRAESPVVLVGSSLGGMAIVLGVGGMAVGDMVRAVALIDVVPAPDRTRAERYLAGSSDDRTGDMSRSPIAEDVLAHAGALEAAAARLTMPTLLVQGTASPVTRDEDVRRFLQLVPHASVRPVVGAGHLVAREAPHVLSDVLLEFLCGLPGSEAPGTRLR